MSPTELKWLMEWERERARGRDNFVVRGFFLIGLLPGAAMGLMLAYVQPKVGETNIGTLEWAIGVFLFVALVGLLRSWWWWHAAEKRYRGMRGVQ